MVSTVDPLSDTLACLGCSATVNLLAAIVGHDPEGLKEHCEDDPSYILFQHNNVLWTRLKQLPISPPPILVENHPFITQLESTAPTSASMLKVMQIIALRLQTEGQLSIVEAEELVKRTESSSLEKVLEALSVNGLKLLDMLLMVGMFEADTSSKPPILLMGMDPSELQDEIIQPIEVIKPKPDEVKNEIPQIITSPNPPILEQKPAEVKPIPKNNEPTPTKSPPKPSYQVNPEVKALEPTNSSMSTQSNVRQVSPTPWLKDPPDEKKVLVLVEEVVKRRRGGISIQELEEETQWRTLFTHLGPLRDFVIRNPDSVTLSRDLVQLSPKRDQNEAIRAIEAITNYLLERKGSRVHCGELVKAINWDHLYPLCGKLTDFITAQPEIFELKPSGVVSLRTASTSETTKRNLPSEADALNTIAALLSKKPDCELLIQDLSTELNWEIEYIHLGDISEFASKHSDWFDWNPKRIILKWTAPWEGENIEDASAPSTHQPNDSKETSTSHTKSNITTPQQNEFPTTNPIPSISNTIVSHGISPLLASSIETALYAISEKLKARTPSKIGILDLAKALNWEENFPGLDRLPDFIDKHRDWFELFGGFVSFSSKSPGLHYTPPSAKAQAYRKGLHAVARLLLKQSDRSMDINDIQNTLKWTKTYPHNGRLLNFITSNPLWFYLQGNLVTLKNSAPVPPEDDDEEVPSKPEVTKKEAEAARTAIAQVLNGRKGKGLHCIGLLKTLDWDNTYPTLGKLRDFVEQSHEWFDVHNSFVVLKSTSPFLNPQPAPQPTPQPQRSPTPEPVINNTSKSEFLLSKIQSIPTTSATPTPSTPGTGIQETKALKYITEILQTKPYVPSWEVIEELKWDQRFRSLGSLTEFITKNNQIFSLKDGVISLVKKSGQETPTQQAQPSQPQTPQSQQQPKVQSAATQSALETIADTLTMRIPPRMHIEELLPELEWNTLFASLGDIHSFIESNEDWFEFSRGFVTLKDTAPSKRAKRTIPIKGPLLNLQSVLPFTESKSIKSQIPSPPQSQSSNFTKLIRDPEVEEAIWAITEVLEQVEGSMDWRHLEDEIDWAGSFKSLGRLLDFVKSHPSHFRVIHNTISLTNHNNEGIYSSRSQSPPIMDPEEEDALQMISEQLMTRKHHRMHCAELVRTLNWDRAFNLGKLISFAEEHHQWFDLKGNLISLRPEIVDDFKRKGRYHGPPSEEFERDAVDDICDLINRLGGQVDLDIIENELNWEGQYGHLGPLNGVIRAHPQVFRQYNNVVALRTFGAQGGKPIRNPKNDVLMKQLTSELTARVPPSMSYEELSRAVNWDERYRSQEGPLIDYLKRFPNLVSVHAGMVSLKRDPSNVGSLYNSNSFPEKPHFGGPTSSNSSSKSGNLEEDAVYAVTMALKNEGKPEVAAWDVMHNVRWDQKFGRLGKLSEFLERHSDIFKNRFGWLSLTSPNATYELRKVNADDLIYNDTTNVPDSSPLEQEALNSLLRYMRERKICEISFPDLLHAVDWDNKYGELGSIADFITGFPEYFEYSGGYVLLRPKGSSARFSSGISNKRGKGNTKWIRKNDSLPTAEDACEEILQTLQHQRGKRMDCVELATCLGWEERYHHLGRLVNFIIQNMDEFDLHRGYVTLRK